LYSFDIRCRDGYGENGGVVTGHRIFETVKDDLERIEQELEENLKSRVPLVSKVGTHILLGGGKRLRPVLFILCARLCGYSYRDHAGLSAIFEYLHAASLLHDDVVDGAGLRRGKASANALWGNSASVLVGDFLYAKSFFLAVKHGHLRVLKVLSETVAKMSEGEVLELANSHNFDLAEDEYFWVITDKTAVLISAACQIGAILADVSREKEDALASFGLNLGIAFQLVDDALDYASTVEEFGKPVGTDLREGKITLPLIHVLGQLSKSERDRLIEIINVGIKNNGDLTEAAQWVDRYGGITHTINRARTYADLAKRDLDVFDDSHTKMVLADLADFVVERRA
jgi:octaprenyl-diphosphate synthase